MSSYRNPMDLLDAIQDLNTKIERGEIEDQGRAGLLIRGHTNAARVQTNVVHYMRLAQKMGALSREHVRAMLGSGEHPQKQT